jgi:hypothetical protein
LNKTFQNKTIQNIIEGNGAGSYFASNIRKILENTEIIQEEFKFNGFESEKVISEINFPIGFKQEISSYKLNVYGRIPNLLDVYDIQTLNSNWNKIIKIDHFSKTIKNRFVFRNDIDEDGEYAEFMRNLFSYVHLGKNIHDDAPDNVTSYCKSLVDRGYLV